MKLGRCSTKGEEDGAAISGEGRPYPFQAPSDASLFPSKAKKRVAKTLIATGPINS
jgi:hypothetical protein